MVARQHAQRRAGANELQGLRPPDRQLVDRLAGFGHAPTTVPEWMGIIVTSAVTKDAAEITGNKLRLVVVHVDAYDPALLGRGTVVADAD